jgi:polysaccharide pyruvyl transferase WcaK-like protein
MPAALLAGSFGLRDPGEEAVLSALLRALPGWEPIVTSRDPAATEAEHGCTAVRDTSGAAIARVAARVDATVLAGGILEGVDGQDERTATTPLARACALVSASNALGKPTAMVGVGSGRLRGRRRRAMARALVKQADLFVLRDRSSAQTLAAAGATPPFRVGADPAWTLFESPAAAAPTRGANGNGGARDSAVVAVLDSEACDESMVGRLAPALGHLCLDGVRVRLQPWRANVDGADDMRLAAVVASRMPSAVEVVEPPAGLWGASAAYEGARVVLAPRRHALIAAAVAGVPALALASDPGLADLARRLGQPVVAGSAGPEAIADGIRVALHRPPPSRSAIQGQVTSAEEAFRLLRLLLSQGRSEDANDLTGLPLEPAVTAVRA